MSTGKTDKNIPLATRWDVRPLGQVVQPTRPRIKPSGKPSLPFIGMENVEAHTMKLLGTVPAGTMKSSAVHFQPDDVLYGRLRPYLNKVYRPDFEGLCSAEFIVFPKTEGISSRYLQYFLNSSAFASYASHLNTGDRPRVDFEQLSSYPFPVAPYEQQERIVAEIEKQFSRLDEAVANLKRVQANLKRYKAAVLKAAVEGHLFDDYRKDVKGNDWVYKPIDIAIDSLDQGWSPQCDNESSERPDVWGVIKTTAVQSMRYLESENKRLPSALRARPKLELVPGDLLMTRAGPRSRVGVVCLVKATRSHLMLCDKVYRIRCKPGVASPAFLELVLNAPNIVDELNQLKTGISDSGVNLTQNRLRELNIPIPSLEEQECVVAEVERRLSIIAELEAAVEANLTRADRLRQSILSQAFNGKLLSNGARG